MTILLFGATGLAGSGVLRVCLDAPAVTEVRALVRRSTGMQHPKLREIIHADYLDYRAVADQFAAIDVCFFCLGVSVQQVSEEPAYRRIHQEFPIAAATMLRAKSPLAQFHYLSGGNAALKSRWMWARVKAEAERDLIAQFAATCWRPGMIDGAEVANQPALTNFFRPVLRLILKPFRNLYVLNTDIGRAMLRATTADFRRRILENHEIRDLAEA